MYQTDRLYSTSEASMIFSDINFQTILMPSNFGEKTGPMESYLKMDKFSVYFSMYFYAWGKLSATRAQKNWMALSENLPSIRLSVSNFYNQALPLN